VRRVLPKVEMKAQWNHDNEISLSTLSQGSITTGPAIAQGAQASARIGNKIQAMGLHIKGILFNNSTQESYVRMMVVGHNGTLDPMANLFRTSAPGTVSQISTIPGLDLMYMPINKEELTVYHDRTFRLGGSASGTAASNTRMISKFVKFNGRKVTYEGLNYGNGYQNWQYSVIWMAADANDDTSTGTAVELSQLTRFYFKDA